MTPTTTVVLATRSGGGSDALTSVDSGRGSSIPSKQSSQGVEEVVVSALRRVEPRDSKKRKLREIIKRLPTYNGDEIDSELDGPFTEELELELDLGSEEELELQIPVRQTKRFCVGVRPPSFVYPKSQYEGYKHSLPKEKEWLAVEALLVSGKE